MNQTQPQRRRLTKPASNIATTNQIVNQLEQKLAGYHQRRRTEQQLLNSHEEPPMPTKTRNTFKLFNQPQTNNTNKMQINQLQLEKESHGFQGQGKVGQLLQEVDAIQQLVRKKLALKEERCAQLERQVELQKEQKLHLYKINTQLQQQLAKITTHNKDAEKKMSAEEQQLELEFSRLRKVYQQKKVQNRRLRQEEELIRRTLKQSQRNQKIYHEGELKVFKNRSKTKLSKKEQNSQQEQYLRNLAGELDKLRKMVKQKLKKSVTRK